MKFKILALIIFGALSMAACGSQTTTNTATTETTPATSTEIASQTGTQTEGCNCANYNDTCVSKDGKAGSCCGKDGCQKMKDGTQTCCAKEGSTGDTCCSAARKAAHLHKHKDTETEAETVAVRKS